MALYGLDFYGIGRYGPRAFLRYNAGDVTANARGRYGELLVTWSSPSGGWSRLRLVRNSFGVPVDENDGVLLVDSFSGPAAEQREPEVRSYLDQGLEPGRFQYYAVWVYDPSADEWTRAGSTTGLALKDFGYSPRLWELTPAVHRTTSSGLLDSDNEELRLFLQLFGGQLDHLRGEYETLLSVNDPLRVAGNLLPLLAQQYGQLYEPELGMRQMRLLLRSTVRLYRTKGTEPGIEGLASAVSGYGARLRPLRNLILDYNDASAEESIGSWTGGYVSSTFERRVADDVVDAPGSLGVMRRKGIFRQVSTNAGTVQVSTASGILRSIPVTPGLTYCFSAHARGGAVGSPNASIGVLWMDSKGVPLSPVVPGNNTYSTGTTLSAPGRLIADAEGGVVRPPVLAAAQLNGRGVLSIGAVVLPSSGVPLNAAGRLRIGSTGTFPSLGTYPGTSTTPGTSALGPLNTKPLNVWAMAARRGSSLRTAPSASFAVTDSAWTRGSLVEPAPAAAAFVGMTLGFTATAAGQTMYWDGLMFEPGVSPSAYEDARLLDLELLAPRVNRVTNPAFETNATGWTGLTRSTAQFLNGVASGTFNPGAADVIAYTEVATVVGTTYTGSLYLRGTGSARATVRGSAGDPLADGSVVTLSTSWQRVSVTFTATETTTRFGARSASAGTVFVDQALLESGGELRPYFDGSTYSTRGDSLWEGTQHASRSHLYPQRQAKNTRLYELLPKYTPLGSSFRLNYALL